MLSVMWAVSSAGTAAKGPLAESLTPWRGDVPSSVMHELLEPR